MLDRLKAASISLANGVRVHKTAANTMSLPPAGPSAIADSMIKTLFGGIEHRIDELLRKYQFELNHSDPLYVELEAHGAFSGFA